MSGRPVVSGDVATNPSLATSQSYRFPVWLSHLLTLALAVSAAFVSFFPLFSHRPWMTFLEDDFFYYLKIADNLAQGHGSTWNGLVLTNGYHPLWFALLAAQSRIFGSVLAVQIFVSLAIFVSTIATYLLARRLLSQISDNLLLTSSLAACVALYSMHLYNGGMEIILAIPLALALALAYQGRWLWQPSFARNFAFGLLASALCLSRLDTTILVALLFVATLLHPALRKRLTAPQVLAVLLGFTPLVLYLLSNRIVFHTWLPVSGMAKELRASHLPASPAWHSLFGKSRAQLLNVGVVLFAIVLLPFLYRWLTAAQQALFPVLLVFPFVYLFVLSCVSDWQLWDWYFYCFRIALCAAFAVLLLWPLTSRLLNHAIVTALIALFVGAQLLLNRRYPSGAGGEDLSAVATGVREFALTHPGVYAMGDRSGEVGYLLPDPLVQTEGLVMDKDFLTLIEHRTPLLDALARYHVRYYIGFSQTPVSGCFHAVEPAQAGNDSAHMTADLCGKPVAVWNQHSGETLLFDLDPQQTSSSAPGANR
jgi:hypothetical protein